MQCFRGLFTRSSIFFFFLVGWNHRISTPFWAGGSASRLLDCPWVLGWRANLARSDRAENAVNWPVCFVAEMSPVCGLFASWNHKKGQ